MSDDEHWPRTYDPAHRDIQKSWWRSRLDAHPSRFPLELTPVTCAWCLNILFLGAEDVVSIACFQREVTSPSDHLSAVRAAVRGLSSINVRHSITTTVDAVVRALKNSGGICGRSRDGRYCTYPAGHLGAHRYELPWGG